MSTHALCKKVLTNYFLRCIIYIEKGAPATYDSGQLPQVIYINNRLFERERLFSIIRDIIYVIQNNYYEYQCQMIHNTHLPSASNRGE